LQNACLRLDRITPGDHHADSWVVLHVPITFGAKSDSSLSRMCVAPGVRAARRAAADENIYCPVFQAVARDRDCRSPPH
jgi:hypothetical protein